MKSEINYRIGLNIGISYVGWAVINIDCNRIEKIGVRCFDSVEDPKTSETKASLRKIIRNDRRKRRRKKYRLEKIKKLFIEETLINKEDLNILFSSSPSLKVISPWILRKEALSNKLNILDLVRILYHISKRRGIFYHKTSDLFENTEGNKKILNNLHLNKSIMKSKNYLTIGEMVAQDIKFSSRIRNSHENYINSFYRDNIIEEVKLIFQKQREFGVDLSENFESKYIDLIKYQRSFDEGPNQPSKYYHPDGQIAKMVGKCCFEYNQPRAAKACFTSEKFIALEKLTKIKLENEFEEIRLNSDDIKKIIENLKEKEKLKYKDLRNILKIPDKYEFSKLNYNKIGEEEIAVKFENYHKIKKCFIPYDEESWEKISDDTIDEIATIIRLNKSDEKVKEKLLKLEIKSITINKLLNLNFTKNHNLSIVALKKIIPFMEMGLTYSVACTYAKYDFEKLNKLDTKSGKKELLLPQININEIVNPVIIRSLSQTRKVANEIIRTYGSPVSVHIKTVKELNKTKAEKAIIKKRDLQRELKHSKFLSDFFNDFGKKPTPCSDEFYRYILYKEQKGICIYSLKRLDLEKAIYDRKYAKIDYIQPFSKSFNNSQDNKVLALMDEINKKQDKTLYEYFSDENRWKEYELYIKDSDFSINKKQNLLKKFITKIESEEIKSKKINDEKYINKYIGSFIEKNLIFKNFDNENQKVYKVSNQIVTFLKNKWNLNFDEENSDIYFCIDAIISACSSLSMLTNIQSYYQKNEKNILIKNKFPIPWNYFREEVLLRISDDIQEFYTKNNNLIENLSYDKKFIEELKPILISRMPNRKGNGLGHAATIRSKKLLDIGYEYTYIKKSISDISLKDIEITMQTPLYNGDKKVYDLIFEKLKKNEKLNIIQKSSKLEEKRDVKKIKIASSDGISGIFINNGIAANGDIIRIDLFKKENKYYFTPIYAHHIEKNILPNKVINGKNEKTWLVLDNTFLFKYSIYPNDYIYIKNKRESFEGYFISANRRNGTISIYNHKNKKIKKESIGIRNIEDFIKFDITILGNKYKIKNEIRK